MANKINATTLREGQVIIVDGIIEFARISSLIEGEELAKRVEQDRKNNRPYPVDYPHTTITIRDAAIRPFSQDPNQLTLEEQFVQDSFYTSTKNPSKGMMYGLENKSDQLPAIYEINVPGDPSQGYSQIVEPQGDPDKDLRVSLVLQTYKPKNHPNRGIALRAVNINEPIRYYNRGGGFDLDQLSNMGIILDAAPQPTVPAARAQQAPNQQSAPAANTSAEGLPTPGLGNQPQNQGYQNQQQAPAPNQQYQQPAPTQDPNQVPYHLRQDQQQPNQGYQQQAPAQQQYQQGYPNQQQQAPQGYPAPQNQGYQQQQPQNYPAPTQQGAPAQAQPGQSAFDASATPMNQAPAQGGQDQNQNESVSPWSQDQGGMHYNA